MAGRATKYDLVRHPELVQRLALLGLTDAEIAVALAISGTCLNNWDDAHPEFYEARMAGREEADARVAESLFKRAVGYSHDDVHITTCAGEVVQTPIVKHYPPDTGAATFWLTNKAGKRWKTKVNNEVTGADGAPLIPVLNVVIANE